MKNLKSICLLLVLLNVQVQAGVPDISTAAKESNTVISLKNSGFSMSANTWHLSARASSFTFAGNRLNVRYVSGLYKGEKASVLANALKWDFKFKFRLNRNMNIIFSYN